MDIRRVVPILMLVALSLPAAAVPAGLPQHSLLGIELGMPDHLVRARLSRLGEPVAGAERRKQSWRLRSGPYGYVAVRYDSEWRVKWVSAFARREGRRLRYRDIGDPARASRLGYYIYTWEVAPPGGPPCRISARGSDSLYVASVALFPAPSPRTPAAVSAVPDTTD